MKHELCEWLVKSGLLRKEATRIYNKSFSNNPNYFYILRINFILKVFIYFPANVGTMAEMRINRDKQNRVYVYLPAFLRDKFDL
jgi:hypothetical protein